MRSGSVKINNKYNIKIIIPSPIKLDDNKKYVLII